jgi:Domain of unknown function (DUF4411)
MHTLDASSIVYAWDNYPIEFFPKLWDWLAGQVKAEALQICVENFVEVKYVAPECADWLIEAGIKRLRVSNAILLEANRIKSLLGISNDNFHSKGVDQNDLLAIACAKTSGTKLITNESVQLDEPKETRKRKIPSVCKIKTVQVDCVDFLSYLRSSGTVFG